MEFLELKARNRDFCFPGNDHIAKGSGRTIKRVKSALTELESVGWIVRVFTGPDRRERIGVVLLRRVANPALALSDSEAAAVRHDLVAEIQERHRGKHRLRQAQYKHRKRESEFSQSVPFTDVGEVTLCGPKRHLSRDADRSNTDVGEVTLCGPFGPHTDGALWSQTAPRIKTPLEERQRSDQIRSFEAVQGEESKTPVEAPQIVQAIPQGDVATSPASSPVEAPQIVQAKVSEATPSDSDARAIEVGTQIFQALYAGSIGDDAEREWESGKRWYVKLGREAMGDAAKIQVLLDTAVAARRDDLSEGANRGRNLAKRLKGKPVETLPMPPLVRPSEMGNAPVPYKAAVDYLPNYVERKSRRVSPPSNAPAVPMNNGPSAPQTRASLEQEIANAESALAKSNGMLRNMRPMWERALEKSRKELAAMLASQGSAPSGQPVTVRP
jgi:hypothetical protein